MDIVELNSQIIITGGNGLVGSALKKELTLHGYKNILTPSSKECDFTHFNSTLDYFAAARADYVFHLAAAVYGIMGNMENKGISFLNNTLINTHVIEACRKFAVKKVVAMGTGCVYPYPSPKLPLEEQTLWQGEPHPSEDSYAHSKRAMLAQLNAYKESDNLAFAFVISSNLYGPHDKFDINHGHVTPSLIRKFFEAHKKNEPVNIWGNGSARRDFMYSEDAARALIAIMQSVQGPVNMGSGNINAIKDIVDILAQHTGMENQIIWDTTKPNGQEYRAYELSKLLSTGFKPQISLDEGVRNTYNWYAANCDVARK